ncbi:MAG TPA: helix-turn-helix domain-containing protein [Candidatus Acidoferrum sp.]|nr:helix-turn-helix domain-containing protein [Candidatus Acidoferrum sp.]
MKMEDGRAAVSERPGGASVSFGELPLVLTVDEARRVLRIGRRQLYQAISRRDVHTVKVGRTIRIPRSSLEAWLAEPDHEPAQSVR